jgi:hypothetical protein
VAAVLRLDAGPEYLRWLGPELGPTAIVPPLVGILGLTIAAGLWMLMRWAWVATMLWAGISMATALASYAAGEPEYILMALGMVTVFYLNQGEVQEAFSNATDEEVME